MSTIDPNYYTITNDTTATTTYANENCWGSSTTSTTYPTGTGTAVTDSSIWNTFPDQITHSSLRTSMLDFLKEIKHINSLTEKEQIKRITNGEPDVYLLILEPSDKVTAVFQAKYEL